MDTTLETLIMVYKMQDIDWLGYKLNESFTYHHLIKKCDGGKRIFNNGAVLYETSHSYLHRIEYYDFEKYVYINNILKEVNNQRYMTTIEQLIKIDYVLKQFEEEHKNYISNRGKVLIKEKYKKRIISTT
jgi:hypothetical protein